MTTALICFSIAIVILIGIVIHQHIKIRACEDFIFQTALSIAKYEIETGEKLNIEGVEIHHYEE